MLAFGTDIGTLRFFDPTTGQSTAQRQTAAKFASAVAISPDGKFVVSVGQWSEKWTIIDTQHPNQQGVVNRTHDGKGACTCRTTRSGKRVAVDADCPVIAHTSWMRTVVFSPCGERIATACSKGSVIIWNVRTGEGLSMCHTAPRDEFGDELERSCIRSLSFSACGTYLAGGGDNGHVHVWRHDAEHVATLVVHMWLGDAAGDAHAVKCVQFSPTNPRQLSMTGQHGGFTSTMDILSREELWSVDGGNVLVYSPDGATVATTIRPEVHPQQQQQTHLRFLDSATGAERHRITTNAEIRFAAFSPDGSKVLTGTWSSSHISVWDASTGVQLSQFALPRWEGPLCAVWGRDWLSDTKRKEAFLMGYHKRLGGASRVTGLEIELMRMVLGLADVGPPAQVGGGGNGGGGGGVV
jgi:WD40 repeat protein